MKIKTDNYEIYKGDCLEVMKDVPDKSVDMILCDLPYGTTDCKWDNVIPFAPLWAQYNRLVKDNGAIVLFAAQPFTTKLIQSNFADFKYCWYWKKNTATGHPFAKFQPMRCVEDICVFRRQGGNEGQYLSLRAYLLTELKKCGLKRAEIDKLLGNTMSSHYFTMGRQFVIPSEKDYKKLQSTGYFARTYDEIKKEFSSARHKREATYNPQGLIKLEKTIKRKKSKATDTIYDMSTLGKEHEQKYTNYPKNLIEFAKDTERLHPTQKPVALLEYLVKTYTNEGDTVLDNCMGSGSTGVACKNTKRKFIGIELEKNYFDIAESRIRKLSA